jgi:hypothetical protein
MTANPKLFISYSWSSPEHKAWVLQLATDLVHSGVEAILDVWDLREGQESAAFMEKMVTDPLVAKVLIVSDRMYAEKSDTRRGGAGTEAQIISAALYSHVEQGKFAAAVREVDEKGKPCVPAYYSSRIYIDFTDDSRRQDAFEQLLRWVFDKPEHRKPSLGPVPQFIVREDQQTHFPSQVAAGRAKSAIEQGKSNALVLAQDYFDQFAQDIIAFRIDESDVSSGGADYILAKLGDTISLRNEAVEVLRGVMRMHVQDVSITVHGFIESIYRSSDPVNYGPVSSRQSSGLIEFVAWEILLNAAALAIKSRRADVFETLVDRQFHLPHTGYRSSDDMISLGGLSRNVGLIEYADRLRGDNHYSPDAHFLKERPSAAGIPFDELLQADFLMYLRTELSGSSTWWPKTYLYGNPRWAKPFPAFARAKSKKECAWLCDLLGVRGVEAIALLIRETEAGRHLVPKWGFDSVNLRGSTGYNELASLP